MKKHDKHHDAPKHMAGGGVTGEAMKKYGRNMARAMNQKASHKSGGRGR